MTSEIHILSKDFRRRILFCICAASLKYRRALCVGGVHCSQGLKDFAEDHPAISMQGDFEGLILPYEINAREVIGVTAK